MLFKYGEKQRTNEAWCQGGEVKTGDKEMQGLPRLCEAERADWISHTHALALHVLSASYKTRGPCAHHFCGRGRAVIELCVGLAEQAVLKRGCCMEYSHRNPMRASTS